MFLFVFHSFKVVPESPTISRSHGVSNYRHLLLESTEIGIRTHRRCRWLSGRPRHHRRGRLFPKRRFQTAAVRRWNIANNCDYVVIDRWSLNRIDFISVPRVLELLWSVVLVLGDWGHVEIICIFFYTVIWIQVLTMILIISCYY